MAKRPPPVRVAVLGPLQAGADHRLGLTPVVGTQQRHGVGKVRRKAESPVRARGAVRLRVGGRGQLHQGAVQVHRAKRMLDDVGDGAEPDVLPTRRKQPHVGQAQGGAGRAVREQLPVPGDQALPGPSSGRHGGAGDLAEQTNDRGVPRGGLLHYGPHRHVDHQLEVGGSTLTVAKASDRPGRCSSGSHVTVKRRSRSARNACQARRPFHDTASSSSFFSVTGGAASSLWTSAGRPEWRLAFTSVIGQR